MHTCMCLFAHLTRSWRAVRSHADTRAHMYACTHVCTQAFDYYFHITRSWCAVRSHGGRADPREKDGAYKYAGMPMQSCHFCPVLLECRLLIYMYRTAIDLVCVCMCIELLACMSVVVCAWRLVGAIETCLDSCRYASYVCVYVFMHVYAFYGIFVWICHFMALHVFLSPHIRL